MDSLYELTQEYMNLLMLAEDPDTDPQVFEDTMEGLEGVIEAKADGYAKVMKNLEAQEEACAKEIKRLQTKKQTYSNSIERMKKNLEKAMIATGKTKFKTDLFSFGIQKNPASIVIDDESKIPPEYWVIKSEVNKSALKDLLKNGEALEYAHLEQTEGLRIR